MLKKQIFLYFSTSDNKPAFGFSNFISSGTDAPARFVGDNPEFSLLRRGSVRADNRTDKQKIIK